MEADSAYGQAIVLDMSGTVQVPNSPYAVVESEMAKLQRANTWPSVDAMLASIKRNAPDPHGLPDGAPNPNTVYLKDGQYLRYVIDSSEPREHYVEGGVVKERVLFTSRMVSLSLDGARRASGMLRADGTTTRCDYWNGFTWLRNGYTPERDFPVMAQMAARSVEGERLVFTQPVSATDEARIRHEVSVMDRARPTLPVERADTIETTVSAAQSVPFPEAAEPAAVPIDVPTLPDDPPSRGPGRPRKET